MTVAGVIIGYNYLITWSNYIDYNIGVAASAVAMTGHFRDRSLVPEMFGKWPVSMELWIQIGRGGDAYGCGSWRGSLFQEDWSSLFGFYWTVDLFVVCQEMSLF